MRLRSVCLLLVAATFVVQGDALDENSHRRQILGHKPSPPSGKGTCKNPKGVAVPDAKKVLSLDAQGELIFYCNNSELEMHGEGGAVLNGTDGWKGKFYYPDTTGLATFKLTNSKTGEKRLIEAKKGPFARAPAYDGRAVGPHRRLVLSDTDDTKAMWVVRHKCRSAAKKPTSTKCNVDQDIIIKYNCTFSFVTC